MSAAEEIKENVTGVVELKGTKQPELNQPFYRGNFSGVREVCVRVKVLNTKGVEKERIEILRYEGSLVGNDGKVYPIVYHHTPPPKTLIDGAVYPVMIWNISHDRKDSQDVIKYWKQFQVEGVTINGRPLVAFHRLILNTDYIPNVRADGMSDDGNFAKGKPVLGKAINDELSRKFNKEKALDYPSVI